MTGFSLSARPRRQTRRLKQALSSVFEDPSIEEMSVEDLAGQYPTVRHVPPDQTFVIDTLRPIDRMDAEALRRKFGLEET